MTAFSDLLGKTLTAIEVDENKTSIKFATSDGEFYEMFHSQDCCEQVSIEDITGDLEDLIGSPILVATEVWQTGDSSWGVEEWTFYKLATVKGWVDIRWYGESNGYYSTAVSFYKKDEA